MKITDGIAGSASSAVLRAGMWFVPSSLGGEVVTWRGDLEVDASALGYMQVAMQTLVQAATDLRLTSAATLAGINP
jgi:hypothetical protein